MASLAEIESTATVGTRWTVKQSHFPRVVWELVEVNPAEAVTDRYKLRVVDGVSPESKKDGRDLGYEMSVELEWFRVRGRRVS